MRATSINNKKLLQLTRKLRGLKSISGKVKRELVDEILKECDIIRRTDIENLICLKHATQLSGYKNASSLFRLAERGRLTVYSPCHKDYACLFDRKEIEKLVPPRPWGREIPKEAPSVTPEMAIAGLESP